MVGLFSISNSTFSSSWGGGIYVNYSQCSRSNHFNFNHNNLSTDYSTLLSLEVSCSVVEIQVVDSIFREITTYGYNPFRGLKLDFNVLANNSVFVDNSSFMGTVAITACNNSDCGENCGHSLIKFSRTTIFDSAVLYGSFLSRHK